MNGAERIAAERQRQIDVEGWTPEHDAQHKYGELARAAEAYLDPGRYRWRFWPYGWAREWFKPTTRIRDLEKAGALIAAEIDRLLRLEGTP